MHTKAWKIGFIIFSVLTCGSCFAGNLVGKNAPQIAIREWVTADPPNLQNLEGQVYVVEFWATWCAPCRKGIPHLISLADKYRDSGLVFISLSADKSADTVHKFVQKKGINYHVAIDQGTADWFQITGYPTAFVVNHKGKVIWQGMPSDDKFEQAISKAVKDCPPSVLAGVNLGMFGRYRAALEGGEGFAAAYNRIREHADKKDNSEACVTAQRIIAAIDKRISERTEQADKLSSRDLMSAYEIYMDIATKYGGIAVSEPAAKAFERIHRENVTSGPLVAKEPKASSVE